MKYFLIIAVMILISVQSATPSAAPAEEGRQVAPGVREVRLDLPPNLTRIPPSGSDVSVAGETAGSIAGKSAAGIDDVGWRTLLADDFESGFPGTTWTLFFEGTGPHWGDWTCWSGTSPSHSVGCAAAGTGAIECGENYPNYLNTFMTAGPISLADSYHTAGFLEAVLKLDSELGADDFFMLVSLNGEDGWSGLQFSGGFDQRTISLDLAEVPFLGNILSEPQVWVSFGFRSDGENVEVNGAQIDDVILYVAAENPPEGLPSLQISALKNPGRPRMLQVLVLVTDGSGLAPTVAVGGWKLEMTSLGDGVYAGTHSASPTAPNVTISASDTNNVGRGAASAVVSFP